MTNKAYQIRLEEIVEQSDSVLDEAVLGKRFVIRLEENTAIAPAFPSSGDRERWMFEYERAQEMHQQYDNLSWHIGSIFIAGILVLTGLALGKDGYETLTRGWRSLVIVFGVPGVSFLILLFWGLWFRRHRGLYRFRDDLLHRLERQLGLYHFLRVLEANRLPEILKSAKELNVINDAELKELQQEPTIEKWKAAYDAIVANPDAAKAKLEKLCETQKKSLWSEIEDGLLEAKIKANKIGEVERINNEGARSKVPVQFTPMINPKYFAPASYALVWRLVFLIPLTQFFILFVLWWANMYQRAPNGFTLMSGEEIWALRWQWGPPLIVFLLIFVSILVLIIKTRKI